MSMAAYAGPDTELRPNAEHISAFVRWWFEHCTDGMIEIGWLDDKGRGLIHFAQFERHNIDELVLTAVQANLVPGQSCYIRASTVSAKSGFTTDADFVQSPGIWNDIDTPEQVQQARSVQTIIRPNAAVITGTRPHMRVQNWIKTTPPITEASLVRSLNTRFHALYGGDSTVVNPSRLMRLPGTIAWPWKKDRTTPELTVFVLPPGSDPRPKSYPLSMLMAQLPGEHQDRQEPPTGARSSLNTAAELMRLIREGDHWHDNMVKLVGHWIARGWSNAEILAAAESFTIGKYTQQDTQSEVWKAIKGGREKWGVGDPEPTIDPPTDFNATSLASLDLDHIPPRRWLYGRELIRGFVAVLGSVGGVGKTAYAMAAGVSVAWGRPLLATGKIAAHCAVHRRGNVWFYNLEDPMEELLRRIKAVLQHHRVPLGDVAARIFIDSGRDRPLVVAIRTAKGALVASPIVDDLVAELKRRAIDVLVIDPFVQSHSAEENRNEEMNLVMSLWALVAHRADCAVWLVHHFRKGGKGGDGESFRGAGAIHGAARAMFTVSAMSVEEADKLGVPEEERWQYIRHDNAKQNMAPPASVATWYRLVSVPLDNGTEEYPEGDHVQAVEAWSPPSPWEGLSMSMVVRILDQLDIGPGGGEQYTLTKRGADNSRWAGRIIVDIGCKTDAQAAEILHRWTESGLVKATTYRSSKTRKDVTGLSVNAQSVREMRQDLDTPNAGEDDI